MSTELKDLAVEQVAVKEKQGTVEFAPLETSLKSLAKAGGFDFLEAIIEGADSMNPVRKAKRNIFLSDANKKEQREQLKKKMKLWIDLVSENSSVSQMVDKSVERAEISERLLKTNLKKV